MALLNRDNTLQEKLTACSELRDISAYNCPTKLLSEIRTCGHFTDGLEGYEDEV
ncbi:hypothetical protein I7I51_00120, partial [Histoplasma capsulatum]